MCGRIETGACFEWRETEAEESSELSSQSSRPLFSVTRLELFQTGRYVWKECLALTCDKMHDMKGNISIEALDVPQTRACRSFHATDPNEDIRLQPVSLTSFISGYTMNTAYSAAVPVETRGLLRVTT